MNRRDFSAALAAAATGASALLHAPSASAQDSVPVEGRDFAKVDPPQPPGTPGKIEVLEFFSYACPHCFAFEPMLEGWANPAPARRRAAPRARALPHERRQLRARVLRARIARPGRRDAAEDLQRHPRRPPAPGKGARTSPPSSARTGATRPSSWPRSSRSRSPRRWRRRRRCAPTTRSTAFLRWWSRAATSPRRRWPAARRRGWASSTC